jgi:hypothetical protein
VKTFSNPQLPKLQMRKPRHGDDWNVMIPIEYWCYLAGDHANNQTDQDESYNPPNHKQQDVSLIQSFIWTPIRSWDSRLHISRDSPVPMTFW